MDDKEATDMMRRCKNEIQSLRGEIGRLRPKAEAYDSLAQVLSLLPRQSQGMGEDIVWTIDIGITQFEQGEDETHKVNDRVLLSPAQVNSLVKFIKPKKK